MNQQLTQDRVKLPKSFLAINLSETHTFHKKESQDETTNAEAAIVSTESERKDSETTASMEKQSPVSSAEIDNHTSDQPLVQTDKIV
jgi:inositol hexakisphosphate/diphosphoinositol-pentakisphosphate kinase